MQRYTDYFIWRTATRRWRQVKVTVFQIPDAVDTVVCAPDDGWRYHPKNVEQSPDKIKCVTLHFVGYILEIEIIIPKQHQLTVSITEIDFVNCAVRAEYLNIMNLNFGLSVAEARLRSEINTLEICGGQIALGEAYLRVLQVFSVNIIHRHLHQHVPLTRSTNG
jgi:hypothetical protein